ncbi:tRNA threonylcarbamoyladenosine dehydratase [Carnobacteriaceae bacterium zg-ZUI252]|nr:tRNA threonylcarbamoyladenosine dehydratase [Carnobacteriaceae bacterium zg-ZUI252]MBS4770387.1 tRNA threonylcarbamoyladenosine dehydratase [Carnobacteriaceae bacterium zg-ZUI240]QTU82521.1 tRNA threonylcarbamoyladenosine dehydratase [Carnobacteriaceae bacterium zg-C25]
MTNQFPERLSRLRLLLKDEGLINLNNATVMVLGLGGVGSSCVTALARGGVGNLIILDRDTVEESNINRQMVAFYSTIGRVKVDVMTELIKDINPNCNVIGRQEFLTKETIGQALSQYPRPDYIIDCIDTVSQKLALAQWCMEENIPLLSSMGAANKLDPTHFKFDYIEKTKYCPLSKVIRTECRRRGIKNLEVLYSDEMPPQLQTQSGGSKAQTLGSMSYMPPIAGQMLAGKIILRLSGLEKFKVTPVATKPKLKQHK